MRRCLAVTLVVLFVGAAARADVQFFTDELAFQDALGVAGKVSKGGVDFDNHEDLFPLPPSGSDVALINDPLNIDNLQGTFLPENFIDNLTFQSNADGPGLSGPNPIGAGGLQVRNVGFGNVVESVLVSPTDASLDILSGPPAGGNHTALSLTLGGAHSSGTSDLYNIYVFDKGETLLDTLVGFSAPSARDGKAFLGILSTDSTIGRVNVWNSEFSNALEHLFEATTYVPEPGTLSLLALSGLALLRRRRR